MRSEISLKIEPWLTNGLGCVAGKREFQKGRIAINVVRDKLDVLAAFAGFVSSVHEWKKVACMFVAPQAAADDGREDRALDQLRRLADLMSVLGDVAPDRLLDGARLGLTIRTACPVTNQIVDFDDFNCIAFCPRAADENDRLYDPLMAAPAPCVNLNSDVFGFSMFTRDLCLLEHEQEVFELPDADSRDALFDRAATAWQTMARKTIDNFVSVTNTRLCPTYVAADERHWYASHQDPAFAESRKDLYRHEMPVIYTRRVIDAWRRWFMAGEPLKIADSTVAGLACPHHAAAD